MTVFYQQSTLTASLLC